MEETPRANCPICREPVVDVVVHIRDNHTDDTEVVAQWRIMRLALEHIRGLTNTPGADPWALVAEAVATAEEALQEAVLPEARSLLETRDSMLLAARTAASLPDAYPPLRAWEEQLERREAELAQAVGRVRNKTE